MNSISLPPGACGTSDTGSRLGHRSGGTRGKLRGKKPARSIAGQATGGGFGRPEACGRRDAYGSWENRFEGDGPDGRARQREPGERNRSAVQAAITSSRTKRRRMRRGRSGSSSSKWQCTASYTASRSSSIVSAWVTIAAPTAVAT